MLEVLFAVALVVVGLVALAVVVIVAVVYATRGAVFIVPGVHAPHR